jgi:peptide-methionine (S)-S-oxide reductase
VRFYKQETKGTGGTHLVLGTPLHGPFPEGLETAYFAMGCFWGAERCFWKLDGVYTTAVGYMGGATRDPSYYEVCSGRTGHAESVMVVFDPKVVAYAQLLSAFFEAHDPTQGDRQGNDRGTQYRSAIFTTTPQQELTARQTITNYQGALSKALRLHAITTELGHADTFYYAEEYHQQYLKQNPGGYCGLAGTGVACPAPSSETASP